MSTADEGWEAATFEGARLASERSAAGATPQQRIAWLFGALRLAESSGALQRARARRQSECDELWSADLSG